MDNISPYISDKLSQIDGDGKDANEYSVAYMWGTVGLIYNPKYISDDEIIMSLSTGSRVKTNINFSILGFDRCSSNTHLKTNVITINDELVHKFKFKKSNN